MTQRHHLPPGVTHSDWATSTTYWRDQQQDLDTMADAMHRAALGIAADHGVRPTAAVQTAVDGVHRQIVAAIVISGCRAEAGGCPTHGQGALTVSPDGWTECDPCGRVWTYDRTAHPCGYPATHDGRCQAHHLAGVAA